MITPHDRDDDVVARAWAKMVADAPDAPEVAEFEVVPWEVVMQKDPNPNPWDRRVIVAAVVAVVVVAVGLGALVSRSDDGSTGTPAASSTADPTPEADTAPDGTAVAESVERVPSDPYLPTWVPEGFELTAVRWYDEPPELVGPDSVEADSVVLGDSEVVSNVSVHIDAQRFASADDLEDARWLEDASVVQHGGPTQGLSIDGAVFAYEALSEPDGSLAFATFHGTIDDVLITGFVDGVLSPSELARLLSTLSTGNDQLSLEIAPDTIGLILLDRRPRELRHGTSYELEFSDGSQSFTASLTSGASQTSVVAGGSTRDGDRIDGERGTGFFESQPEVGGALGSRRLRWWVPEVGVRVWFGGVLSDDQALRVAESVQPVDADQWRQATRTAAAEVVDFGVIALPEDPQQTLTDRLAEREAIGDGTAEPDVDVPAITEFVGVMRGGELPSTAGVDWIGPLEAERLTTGAQFLPDATWHVLRALGLVGVDDDQGELADIRRRGVLGACCQGDRVNLVDGMTGPEAAVASAHEFTHLYDLQILGAAPRQSNELMPVWGALSEGNATRVMRAYRDEHGIDLDLENRSYERVGLPAAVQRIYRFAYLDGEVFVTALAAEGGEAAVDRALLQAPPTSSEQVLHPDAYRTGDNPTPVPAPEAPAGAVVEARSTLGAFVVALAVEDALAWDDAVELVAAWSGDRYVAWSEGERRCITATVEFDDAASAHTFVTAMRSGPAQGPEPGSGADVATNGTTAELTACG